MSPSDQKINRTIFAIMWLIFSVFILYGTLIPFNLSTDAGLINTNISRISWIPFIDADGSRASIPDMVQNILFFIPFGFVGIFAFKTEYKIIQIIKITVFGALLSGIVEILQLFTIDRTTSITDLLTNAFGAFMGASLAFIFKETYSKFISLPQFQQFRRDKFFFLVLIASIFVAISALQPFDFTLDVGSVWSKVKSLISNPIEFHKILKDEAVAFIRLFLLGYVWSYWLKRQNMQSPVLKGMIAGSIWGLFFEGCQIIVQSRMPNIQDAIIIIFASYTGAQFAQFNIKTIPNKIWILIIISATWVSAGIQMLSPFAFMSKRGGFNLVPFMAYYERTTFIALANFTESMLIYMPMGFILELIYYNTDRMFKWIRIGLIAVLISFTLEFAQMWIVSRYADITDILGAVIGSIAGALVCWQWRKSFTPALDAV